jgi:hypothetical protein
LLKEKGQDFQAVISHPTYSLPFLNPGRLIEVRDGDADFGWGVVVAYNKVINPKVSSSIPDCYVILMYRADHLSLPTPIHLRNITSLTSSSRSLPIVLSRRKLPAPVSLLHQPVMLVES